MEANYREYRFLDSLDRLDEILGSARGQFEQVDALPERDRLTFTNGFYGQYCTAVFVDIRDSSRLPEHYNRPQLAKIYRAYLSENVAILNGVDCVREVNIVGDAVWAVYNTPKQRDNNEVFDAVCRARTFTRVLNKKLDGIGYETPLRAGVGVADGRALMIKAGFKGSGINDVVYMGDVVNRAAKLAAEAGRHVTAPILANSDFHRYLNDENKALFDYDWRNDRYTSWAVMTQMDSWASA